MLLGRSSGFRPFKIQNFTISARQVGVSHMTAIFTRNGFETWLKAHEFVLFRLRI